MAADLHIHIMTDDITDDDLKCFFGHTIGHPLGIVGENLFDIVDYALIKLEQLDEIPN